MMKDYIHLYMLEGDESGRIGQESGTTVVPSWTRGTLSSGDQGIQRS
jgi:hypothetical protein